MPYIVLPLLLVMIVGMRLYTYHEPLERDITTYAVIGHELLQGRNLYADLWDHKPPAIYVTYAVAMVFFGYGPGSVFFLNVLAASLTLWGVYLAAAGEGRINERSGLLAAGLWVFLSVDPLLQANQPNVEVFINVCLVWLFVLFLREDWLLAPKPWPGILGGGVLLALATLYKQVAIIPFLTLAVVYLLLNRQTVVRRRVLMVVLGMAVVGTIVWLFVFGYFTLVQRLRPFYEAVFLYNQEYAGSLISNIFAALRPEYLLRMSPPSLTLLIVTLVGILVGSLRANRRAWLLLGSALIGAYLAVVAPGQFYPHYYQLLLPFVAIGASWVPWLFESAQQHQWQAFAAPLRTALLVFLILFIAPYYILSQTGWSVLKYGPLFVRSENIGRRLAVMLKPNETFYEWGLETGLYFASQRSPVSGIFYIAPLASQTVGADLRTRLLRDLEEHPVDLFIINRTILWPSLMQPAVAPPAELLSEYRMAGSDTDFDFYVRRSSNLEHRLSL